MENKALKNAANGFGDLWGTPPDLWAEIRREFFPPGERIYDPCPGKHPLANSWPEPNDGLKQDWNLHSNVFVNPPFSDIWPWVERAALFGYKNCNVVMLVPIRCDQPWWETYVPFASITFIRGRVQYINHRDGKAGKTPAFPSVLLTFNDKIMPNAHWWPICHQERMKRHIAQTTLKLQGVNDG